MLILCSESVQPWFPPSAHHALHRPAMRLYHQMLMQAFLGMLFWVPIFNVNGIIVRHPSAWLANCGLLIMLTGTPIWRVASYQNGWRSVDVWTVALCGRGNWPQQPWFKPRAFSVVGFFFSSTHQPADDRVSYVPRDPSNSHASLISWCCVQHCVTCWLIHQDCSSVLILSPS